MIRLIAIMVLHGAAWLSLVGGVIGCVALLIASEPEPIRYGSDDPATEQPLPSPAAASKWHALGLLLSGVVGWAGCITLVLAEENSNQLRQAMLRARDDA